jgi:hypothetical protein
VTNGSDKVRALAALLRDTGAKPRVSPDRVVRSTLYDLDYHIALVACVFFMNGEQRTDNARSMVAHWLKILQFIAVRPALLADFQSWAKSRRDQNLETWQKMPRGYLGDRTHDRTIELLVAGKILYRTTDVLISGERFSLLKALYENIVAKDLFASERETLRELASIRVNKTLLRGE